MVPVAGMSTVFSGVLRLSVGFRSVEAEFVSDVESVVGELELTAKEMVDEDWVLGEVEEGLVG